MSIKIEEAIIVAISRDGSTSEVERLGFSSVQITLALRNMLKSGALVRRDAKFALGPETKLPNSIGHPHSFIGTLTEYAIEKMGENDAYEIGHRTFAQIRDRVRP